MFYYVLYLYIMCILYNIGIQFLFCNYICSYSTVAYLLIVISFSFKNVLHHLNPVLKYFLLHPSPSSEHIMASSYLHTSLLSLVETLHTQDSEGSPSVLLLDMLTSLLPLTPAHSNQCLLIFSKQVQVSPPLCKLQ